MERLWCDHVLLGGDRGHIDNSTSFEVAGDDTVESVIAGYRSVSEASRQTFAEFPLDRRAVQVHDLYGQVTLRWILLHLIEETARHCGHMGILRELTDGRAG